MTEPVRVTVIREPDDAFADVRISIGAKQGAGIYLVFRGEPAATLELLEHAVIVARHALPAGHFEDKRARPRADTLDG